MILQKQLSFIYSMNLLKCNW